MRSRADHLWSIAVVRPPGQFGDANRISAPDLLDRDGVKAGVRTRRTRTEENRRDPVTGSSRRVWRRRRTLRPSTSGRAPQVLIIESLPCSSSVFESVLARSDSFLVLMSTPWSGNRAPPRRPSDASIRARGRGFPLLRRGSPYSRAPSCGHLGPSSRTRRTNVLVVVRGDRDAPRISEPIYGRGRDGGTATAPHSPRGLSVVGLHRADPDGQDKSNRAHVSRGGSALFPSFSPARARPVTVESERRRGRGRRASTADAVLGELVAVDFAAITSSRFAVRLDEHASPRTALARADRAPPPPPGARARPPTSAGTRSLGSRCISPAARSTLRSRAPRG